MAIKILPELDLYLTREENERYRQEYDNATRMMTSPPSFETWVRNRKGRDEMFT